MIALAVAAVLVLGGLLCLRLAYVSHRNGQRRRFSAPPPAVVRRPVRTVRADVPTALYGYEWVGGEVCYLGISNEPTARDRRHAVDPDDAWWYGNSTKTMRVLAWFPNRAEALAAERRAIGRAAASGAFLANTHHNPNRRRIGA